MFRPDTLTGCVVWTLERGGPVRLTERQSDELLAFFMEADAVAAFHDLHDAHVAVGFVPFARATQKAA